MLLQSSWKERSVSDLAAGRVEPRRAAASRQDARTGLVTDASTQTVYYRIGSGQRPRRAETCRLLRSRRHEAAAVGMNGPMSNPHAAPLSDRSIRDGGHHVRVHPVHEVYGFL